MRIAYMPDTHFGRYDQQIPDRLEVSGAAEQLLDESIAAERFGFDGVWLAERHARTETFFPSPLVLAAAIAA
jgi:alkanesulfonate monooxygenase SsuD/methylene tetrahydromethanopterin reductase-like flavin-dependent oxidoreductase (luciferase family)